MEVSPRPFRQPPRRQQRQRSPLCTVALLPAAVLILVLLICAFSLWCVSYRHFTPELSLALGRGQIWATTGGTYDGPGPHSLRRLDSPFVASRLNWWPEGGVFWRHARSLGRSLRLPLRIPAALLTLAATLTIRPWFRAHTRRHQLGRGPCPTCAGDRGAHTNAPRTCPECGRVSYRS